LIPEIFPYVQSLFLEHKAILLTMNDCEACKELQQAVDGVPRSNEGPEIETVNCALSQQNLMLCQYFSLRNLPVFLMVKEAHFYIYPYFWPRESDALYSWIHFTYGDSFTQDRLPSLQPPQGLAHYQKQASRLFMHLMTENAAGFHQAGLPSLPRYLMSFFTVAYLVFPVCMVYIMGKQWLKEWRKPAAAE
jgi:hypothetical protein